MISFLRQVRASGGETPSDHYSHDHLNEQKEVPVKPGTIERWAEEFRRIGEEREKAGEKLIWLVLDGFLLYWNRVCRKPLHGTISDVSYRKSLIRSMCVCSSERLMTSCDSEGTNATATILQVTISL